MDEYEFYEEIDENVKRDSKDQNKSESISEYLDKSSSNNLTPLNIKYDLKENTFIPSDDDLPSNELKLEDDFEPYNEIDSENDLKLNKEKIESTRIFNYHPNIDIPYFKQIDTKKKAYWLGFLFADGFIKTDKGKPYRVGVDAGIKDRWIIDRFIKDIGLNPKYIQNLKNRFRISFICKEIIRDLIRNGLIPGKEKSNNINFPQLKTRELNLAFLLGYFDGDGTRKTSKITSGSKIFLEQIKKKFCIYHKLEIVRSGGPIDGRELDGVAYRLALGSSLFNEMLDNYTDSLPRKRNRFKTEEERIESIKNNAWNGSHKRKFIISKPELEELASLMPLYKIGEKFGVSGKTVKKYCTKWGIKIPIHGSWSKKKEKK